MSPKALAVSQGLTGEILIGKSKMDKVKVCEFNFQRWSRFFHS